MVYNIVNAKVIRMFRVLNPKKSSWFLKLVEFTIQVKKKCSVSPPSQQYYYQVLLYVEEWV